MTAVKAPEVAGEAKRVGIKEARRLQSTHRSIAQKAAIAALLVTATPLLTSTGTFAATSTACQVISPSALKTIFKWPRVSSRVRTKKRGTAEIGECSFSVWRGPAHPSAKEKQRLLSKGKLVTIDIVYHDGEGHQGFLNSERGFTNSATSGPDPFDPATFGAEVAHAYVVSSFNPPLIIGSWFSATLTPGHELGQGTSIEVLGKTSVATRVRYERVASFVVPVVLHKLSSHHY
jgi:hypothetical protein